MRLDRHPAHGLYKVADQMASRMHARVEQSALFVDADWRHPGFYRLVDKMNDPLGILNHAQHLAFADPASVARLSTALGMEQGRAQDHGKLVFVRGAFQDFHVGLELITMEKKAQRHISGSIEFLFFIIGSLHMRDNPANHQRTVAL
ncbi:hypothetical protein D3C87_1614490 [compost metagenome]